MCRWCVLTAGLVLLQCIHAQTSSTGGLSGTVIDPAHLVVSGADMQLVNSGTRRSCSQKRTLDRQPRLSPVFREKAPPQAGSEEEGMATMIVPGKLVCSEFPALHLRAVQLQLDHEISS
jgi:hypothetical protein